MNNCDLSVPVQTHVYTAVSGLKDASRRAVAAHDSTVESTLASSSVLKTITQLLAQEKIALTAAVTNAEQNASEAIARVIF